MIRRAIHPLHVLGTFGLIVLSLKPLAHVTPRPAVSPIPLSACVILVPSSCTPSERARRAGWQYRIRAKLAVEQEIEGLEAWDPGAVLNTPEHFWRRQLMARDRGGDLLRARMAAHVAAARARNRAEAYRAALLLACLDCDAGDHHAELKHAWWMMVLQPHSEQSLYALLHAAWCNGLQPLARRAAVALRRLQAAPEQTISAPGVGGTAGRGRHQEVPGFTRLARGRKP